MVIKLTSVTENPLKKPTKPNAGIFSGYVLLIFPISKLEKKRWYDVVLPSLLGFFRAQLMDILHPPPNRQDSSPSAKTAWGKNFHPNQSEVRMLKFLGVNCQVGQHSSLSCNSAPFLQRGFYTGRGVEATRPNWLLKICMCLLWSALRPYSRTIWRVFGPSLYSR